MDMDQRNRTAQRTLRLPWKAWMVDSVIPLLHRKNVPKRPIGDDTAHKDNLPDFIGNRQGPVAPFDALSEEGSSLQRTVPQIQAPEKASLPATVLTAQRPNEQDIMNQSVPNIFQDRTKETALVTTLCTDPIVLGTHDSGPKYLNSSIASQNIASLSTPNSTRITFAKDLTMAFKKGAAVADGLQDRNTTDSVASNQNPNEEQVPALAAYTDEPANVSEVTTTSEQDKDEDQRLQELLKRFGGVDGLERHVNLVTPSQVNNSHGISQRMLSSTNIFQPHTSIATTRGLTQSPSISSRESTSTSYRPVTSVIGPVANQGIKKRKSNSKRPTQKHQDPNTQRRSTLLPPSAQHQFQLSTPQTRTFAPEQPSIAPNVSNSSHSTIFYTSSRHPEQTNVNVTSDGQTTDNLSANRTITNGFGTVWKAEHFDRPNIPQSSKPKKSKPQPRIYYTQRPIQNHPARSGTRPRGVYNAQPSFVEFRNNSAAWWPSLHAHLQGRRTWLTNSHINENIRKACLYDLGILQNACERGDVLFLLLFQTYSIFTTTNSLNIDYNLATQQQIRCLHYIFQPLGQSQLEWCATFPCPLSRTLDQLQEWYSEILPTLNQIQHEISILTIATHNEGRPPVFGLVEQRLPHSLELQRAVTRALVRHVWAQPYDECLTAILIAYDRARTHYNTVIKRQRIEVQQALLVAEQQRFLLALESYMRTHLQHTARAAGPAQIAPPHAVPQDEPLSRNGIPGEPSANTIYQPLVNTIYQPLTNNVHQTTVNTAHQPVGNTVDQPPVTTINRPTQVSSDVRDTQNDQQGLTRATQPHIGIQMIPATLPVLELRKDSTDMQVTEAIIQNVLIEMPEYAPIQHGTTITQNNNFPLGFPIHHVHLRDPVVQVDLGHQQNTYFRSYISDIPRRAWTFGPEMLSRLESFQIEDAQFQKFPKEIQNQVEEPKIRKVLNGTQFIRLRGVMGAGKRRSDLVLSDIHWPNTLAVTINGKALEFRRKPQYHKDLAVNITKYLLNGANSISMSFYWILPPPENFRYNIALEVVTIADLESLKALVKTDAKDVTESRLRKQFNALRDDDDEMEMDVDSINIHIDDPFIFQPCTTPVRSIHCRHNQCFDLDVFLKSRPEDLNDPDHFLCPICKKDARPQNLRIDEWMLDVIAQLKTQYRLGVKVITVAPDLTWRIKIEADVRMTGNDHDEAGDGGNGNLVSQEVEVIELDSD